MFPRIDSSALLTGIDATPEEIEEAGFSELFLDIASYITFSPDPEFDIIRPSVYVKTLDKKQAFLLLNQLEKDLTLSGAIHLPRLEMILIQDNTNYMLKYGDNPAFELLTPFSFDKSNGFYCAGTRLALIDIILEELNVFFKQWKENNYQGTLFPDNLMTASHLSQSNPRLFSVKSTNLQSNVQADKETNNLTLKH